MSGIVGMYERGGAPADRAYGDRASDERLLPIFA